MISLIVLLLTLLGHDMVFISFAISLEIHYMNTFHFINYKTITPSPNINYKIIGLTIMMIL